MGNCLVTKLKGVVDNDNLLKLGECRVKVRTTGCDPTHQEYDPIRFKINGSVTFTILSDSPDDVFVNENGGSVEIGKTVTLQRNGGDVGLYFKRTDGTYRDIDIKISNKYNVIGPYLYTKLGSGNTLEDLVTQFYTSTYFLIDNNYERLTGNLSAVSKRTDIYYLGIGNTNVIGNTSDIVNLTKMQTLGFPQGVGGSLENLKGMTNLILLYLNNSSVGAGESINALFNYWAGLGKEGELDFHLNSVVIAENDAQGNPPADGKVVFANNTWHWHINV